MLRPTPAPLLLAFLLLAGCSSPASNGPAAPEPAAPAAWPGVVLHTEAGDVAFVLYADAAPQTVALLTSLVREGYYDGKSFGRVVPGHVIQQVERDGGTATDDPRRVPLEAAVGYHFSAGAVGIARGEDPGSGGPEFFVMDYATSHLDGNFTVVGQVVQGLDVVHRIARVPAVAFPAQAQLITDRAAVVPVQIRTAELTDLTLDAEEAAALPMQVARNVRIGDFRHSLEWPADLKPGAAGPLTWYVRPYNDTPSIDPARLALRVDGEPVALQPEAGLPDILHFTWTPPAAGRHEVTLLRDGTAWAALAVDVPAA